MSKFKDWFENTFAVTQNENNLDDNTTENKRVAPSNTPFKNTKADTVTTTKRTYPQQTQAQVVKPAIVMSEKTSTKAKVHTFEPKSIDDAKKVIEYLKKNYAVLLNLENTDNALSQRIVDVVSGALFLLDGDYSIITDDIYLMAPKGVEISSPINEESFSDKDIENSSSQNKFSFKK